MLKDIMRYYIYKNCQVSVPTMRSLQLSKICSVPVSGPLPEIIILLFLLCERSLSWSSPELPWDLDT